MKINQVEELVGITKKNIRFYEDQGLLHPERNPENGYRDYSLRDVDDLMKIKLLRKISVPIADIRLLQENRMDFVECMNKQIDSLKEEEKHLIVMRGLCDRLSREVSDLSSLNAAEYLSDMNQMEVGGSVFMDITKKDIKKKKHGPMIAAIAMIILFIAMIGLCLWGNYVDPIPSAVLAFIIAIFVLPIIGIIVALRQRFHEINGGEEDEARKY